LCGYKKSLNQNRLSKDISCGLKIISASKGHVTNNREIISEKQAGNTF
jgi:hypothetical protein